MANLLSFLTILWHKLLTLIVSHMQHEHTFMTVQNLILIILCPFIAISFLYGRI